MEQQSFSIKALPELKLRTAFKSPIEILSFKMTMGFDNIDTTTNGVSWLLERAEVCIEGQWLPVKEPGMDVYYPATLSDNYVALLEIVFEMLAFMKSVFKKSSELSQK